MLITNYKHVNMVWYGIFITVLDWIITNSYTVLPSVTQLKIYNTSLRINEIAIIITCVTICEHKYY